MAEQDGPPSDLARLQGWMLQACAAPGGLEEGLGLARARFGLDAAAVVVGSDALGAQARLGVYARGYRARLLECLGADFPVLKALAGADLFELFAHAYLAARPPRSYSLYDLGGGFADWLRAVRPGGPDTDPVDAVPAELAQLERARAEASRAEGVERLPPGLDGAGLLLRPDARARLPDSVRLLELGFDLLPLLAAVDRGEPPPAPALAPEGAPVLCAVARSRWRVRVHRLGPGRLAWLRALGPKGAGVQDAVARASDAAGLPRGELWADLLAWAPLAAEAGLIVADPG